MTFSNDVSKTFDKTTQVILNLCNSQYLNLGYWKPKKNSFSKAQQKLVEVFGKFSRLDEKSEVVDVGCGTGEQDFYYADQYKCKKIIGINTSKVQFEIASNKLKSANKTYPSIKFKIADAMKLSEWPERCCNNVIALESAQMFNNKINFFKGAYHILKPKGYLCIAEPIPQYKFIFNKKILFDLLIEIFKIPTIREIDENKVKEKTEFFLKNFEGLVKLQLNYHVLYDDYFEMLRSIGFEIDEIMDISKEVFGAFPTQQASEDLIKAINTHPTDTTMTDLLMTMLVGNYFHRYAYNNNLLGYYLIRANR